MDQFQYEMSRTTQGLDDSPYTSKTWGYIVDTQNGIYSHNQVKFDTSSLYNSQKFIGVNEMYVEIPLIVVMSQNQDSVVTGGPPATAFTANNDNRMPSNDWAVGFKSGYFHCIDSMTISYDTKGVQQPCSHTNFYTSFKINSTMSYNDLLTVGPSLGVYPDTATSWKYSQTAGVGGVGLQNNQNFDYGDNLALPGKGESYNKGFKIRQLKTSVSNAKATDLLSVDTFKATGRNWAQNVPAENVALYLNTRKDYQVYYVTATVRLGDMSSFVANCPLVKGFYANIALEMNMGSFKLEKTALTSLSLTQNNVQFPHTTCPIMVAPLRDTTADDKKENGMILSTAQSEVVVGIYIQRVTASSFGTVNHKDLQVPEHPLGSCRLYYPAIEMQPEKALSYINENRNKYIEFEELAYTTLQNIQPGNTIDFNVSNGVVNPVGVLVIPMLNNSKNSLNAGNANLFPQSSPFTCEPACTSPLGIHQFNLIVAGAQIFPNGVNYDYEMFLQEILGCNSINGGQSMGLTSGLIDEIAYNNIYKYYWINLERRSTDNVAPKSIRLSGFNRNAVPMDLHIYIVSKKSVVIDVETGKLVSSSQ